MTNEQKTSANQIKDYICTFVYNPSTGELLRRNAKSWAQITIFYICFYLGLATFWTGLLAIVLFIRIDPEVPTFYGQNSIIGTNPGVGYHPWLKTEPESTLISFNPSDPASYSKYIDVIKEFLEKYHRNSGKTRNCSGTQTNAEIMIDGRPINRSVKACRFDPGIFEQYDCGVQNDFGFRDGQPCIILSLNRLIGWKPVDFNDTEVPEVIKDRYRPGSIAFNCEGSYESDKEHLGKIHYIPPEGIHGHYYPYALMDNYEQPIAMAKFMNLPRNHLMMVECAAYAKNIEQDRDSLKGMVAFELLVKDVGMNKNAVENEQ